MPDRPYALRALKISMVRTAISCHTHALRVSGYVGFEGFTGFKEFASFNDRL